MLTSAEIQMIRNADPGAVLPGIDTPTGNPLPVSSLVDVKNFLYYPGCPYFYNPITNAVYVTKSGTVLNGINFGDLPVVVSGTDVTIKDCTFTGGVGWWAVRDDAGASDFTIENCTFQGSESPTEINDWILGQDPTITIKGNSFLDSPSDAIDFNGGVVTGNYFAAAGYSPGAHADAIWLSDSKGPTTITNNLFDETQTPGTPAGANSALRLTTETGSLSNVTASGNYLFGGSETVQIGPGTNSSFTISNVSITDNVIGFWMYGEYYPNSNKYASFQGNTLVTYSNPASSAQALAAYQKTGIMPAHVIAATAAGQVLTSTASAPTTLVGNNLATTFVGSTNETNFVSGYDAIHSLGGQGANIFTFLAISDATASSHEYINNFDPAKDVIDLSRIDANITTPGLQHFTFIGTAPFSGTGAKCAISWTLRPTKPMSRPIWRAIPATTRRSTRRISKSCSRDSSLSPPPTLP
jgi:hypothetical protein